MFPEKKVTWIVTAVSLEVGIFYDDIRLWVIYKRCVSKECSLKPSKLIQHVERIIMYRKL
jgi:hypothetical protein